MDIRGTLANVCTKVLHDHSVSNDVLEHRARALKILGELFISKGGSMAAGLGDVKTRLHNQMSGAGAEAKTEDKDADVKSSADVKNSADSKGSADVKNNSDSKTSSAKAQAASTDSSNLD